MTTLSFTDFRRNMANSFDLVDDGEHVFINRGSKKMYAIIPVGDDDLTITPALAAKIENARKEYRDGRGVSLKTHEDIDKYFESLQPMYEVKVSSDAEKVIKKWKKSNPQLFKRYQKLFHELADHPRTGIGHPEPLRGGNDVTYSRRITAHDRIIYDIYDDVLVVLVIETEGHYNDK